MSLLEGISFHYRIFGAHGVYVAAAHRLTHKPHEITVHLDGIAHPIHLRMHTSDLSVFEEIILDEEYLINSSFHPRTVIDAGANIGLTSIYFANKYPDARIFAIEPEDSNFLMLTKNVSPYRQITPIKAALWNDCKVVQLTDPCDAKWAFQTHESGVEGLADVASVPGITVDAILSQFGLASVDLLKVDIEGAEKEVFEKAAGWIYRVGAVVVEMHDRFKAGCSDSVLGALKDFPVTWVRGETTFFFRDNAGANAGRPEALSDRAGQTKQWRHARRPRIVASRT